MSSLIDTTEMYLRTIYELEEEGVLPLRARIAERLGQSGPTVSQTVARMQRDGLVSVEDDRHLLLSDEGRSLATRVMRKHRLAECLLADVIGLEWGQVHEEACRWEHVMSEAVERRLLELLGHPTTSPFGNPIPGLEELGDPDSGHSADLLAPASEVAQDSVTSWEVRRIAEPGQADAASLEMLAGAGVRPGARITLQRTLRGIAIAPEGPAAGMAADASASPVVVTQAVASSVFVLRDSGHDDR